MCPSTIHQAPIETYHAAREQARAAPLPARVGNVVCATAGWTDPTLLKETDFYPKGVRAARDRLVFYAQHFNAVEVDATYYALLPPVTARNWISWTDPTFMFDVKAHPVLTGQPIDVSRLPADLRDALVDSFLDRGVGRGTTARVYADRLPAEMREAIEGRFREFLQPLLDEGRLGAVLLQFPPWFTAKSSNARWVEQVAERLAGVPLAVEFRHESWNLSERRQRVLDLLRAHEISLVCTDAPATHGHAALCGVTNPKLAVVRFHGRNALGWAKKSATVHERFSYLYSADELTSWVSSLRAIAHEAEAVHAVFNNCYRDYAVLNAKGLAALLQANPER